MSELIEFRLEIVPEIGGHTYQSPRIARIAGIQDRESSGCGKFVRRIRVSVYRYVGDLDASRIHHIFLSISELASVPKAEG
jgi:hypothetical protein